MRIVPGTLMEDFAPIVANKKQFDALKPEQKKALMDSIKAAVTAQREMAFTSLNGTVGVICAGTGDIPVAEEAACCLEASRSTTRSHSHPRRRARLR